MGPPTINLLTNGNICKIGLSHRVYGIDLY